MNTKIFRDLSNSPDEELLKGLRKQPLIWGYFTALVIIPYTLALQGGTEKLMPWQLYLIGTVALFFLMLGLIGHKKLCAEITKRITETKNPNQQVEPIVTTPVDEVEAQSTQGHP